MFKSADALARMRATQVSRMPDTCQVLNQTDAQDDHGQEVPTYTAGASIPCGLQMNPGSEPTRSDGNTLVWDATLRLPIGTAVDALDRIRITHRFGEAEVTDYDIVGPVQKGPSAIRLKLKKVVPSV